MSRTVELPPGEPPRSDGARVGGWWHTEDEPGRIVCDLCPRECHLKPGDRGFCFVRENRDGEMLLTTYGRSTGFCVDPIEKKPLNHFFPGTSVLSFGTAGCNLGCQFCQNWDISKSREVERLSERATPDMVAAATQRLGCRSVAYTYNDPIIWAEYAIDCARACRSVGVKSVAVTAGYITSAAREPFFREMDAANVDLKAFTEEFYYKITYSHLQPVLETLEWLKNETQVWFEITNLIIPQANDSPDEMRQMCDWILQHVGDDVPVHFTAFHPDFRMQDRPATPHETLLEAYDIARSQGIKFVYVGNVHDTRHESTYCPACNTLLVERDWHQLGEYGLKGNQCSKCGELIPGHFDPVPGDWGRKRMPVRISDYALSSPTSGVTVLEPSPSTPTQVPLSDFSENQQHLIHEAASEIVAARVVGRPPQLDLQDLAEVADQTVMGCFVTLKRQGQLRGCCGVLGMSFRLMDAVRHAAERTATDDVRMPPVSSSELPYLDLDVSLLHSFESVTAEGAARIAAVEVGRHGLTIQRGKATGRLLPSVATENGWDAETFLRQVCNKAGLPTAAWQDSQAQLQTFCAAVFKGPLSLSSANPAPRPTISTREIDKVTTLCRSNLLALLKGATPNYYLSECPDGTVQGVLLTIVVGEDERSFVQCSPRPGVPFQSTLFQLVEAAAKWLASHPGLEPSGLPELKLLVLTDPAMHGRANGPDLRGFEPGYRALMVLQDNRSGWLVDDQQSADETLDELVRRVQVDLNDRSDLFSFAAVGSHPRILVTNVPEAEMGTLARPAARAGSFYPADATQLNAMLDDLLPVGNRGDETWPAVMVPHAGLPFSGQVAGATFNRIRFPDTVIVLGPKHTRLGVQAAVAPHETWMLPGGQLSADPALARHLADRISGLELDSVAHRDEHSVEVELPLIHRLAPESRVVGIVLGRGDLNRCRTFAEQLAAVIREMPEAPLLVISSDMNHFANDDENRKLDRLALDALSGMDPETVWKTVHKHHISMCGVNPAVIVLETLRLLDRLSQSQEVDYATSAEVTGDKSRVVGYAGMLFG